MRRPLIGMAVALAIGIAVAVGAIGSSFVSGSGSRPGVAGASTLPSSSAGATSPSPAPSSIPTAVPSPSPSASPDPSANPSPSPSPELVPAPLTGVLVPPAVAERHPIAVMVDDLSAARPQSGFSGASVVWQAPAEGGIPRYMMVFQDGVPAAVGPVRSARHYFIAWAAEWRAVYVHVGGSPIALSTLKSKGRGEYVYNADEFRYGGRYLWRISERAAPHNVYSDGKTLRRLARVVGAEDGPLQPAWRFGPDAPLAERPRGGLIDVAYPYNRITYRYDRASNTYLRSVTGEKKQVDAATGDRVAPRNVVVMYVSFAPLNDGSKKHRLEATVVGTGVAWIATNGRTIKGTWRKDGITEPTRFFDGAGRPVTLTAGQTFVQVVPRGTSLTVRDGRVPLPTPRSSTTARPA